MPMMNVTGYKVYYRDEYPSPDTLLFLHGIPLDHTLWDGVIDALKSKFRVIAPDFLGFGQSDKPKNIEYTLETYTRVIEDLADALHLESFVIVAMDLGLMAGLNYWVRNPGRVKGLVLFEGLLAGLDASLSAQSFTNRIIMNLMRSEPVARKAFVVQGAQTVQTMIEKGTVRKIPEAINYAGNWTDPKLCEKILLRGVCAHTISNSRQSGDLLDATRKYFDALCESEIPKMILFAKPGAAVTSKSVRQFKPKFRNCEWVFIGKGKHFLPFDQPDAIAREIGRFMLEKNPDPA